MVESDYERVFAVSEIYERLYSLAMHHHGATVDGAHKSVPNYGSDSPSELEDRIRERTRVRVPLCIVEL